MKYNKNIKANSINGNGHLVISGYINKSWISFKWQDKVIVFVYLFYEDISKNLMKKSQNDIALEQRHKSAFLSIVQ